MLRCDLLLTHIAPFFQDLPTSGNQPPEGFPPESDRSSSYNPNFEQATNKNKKTTKNFKTKSKVSVRTESPPQAQSRNFWLDPESTQVRCLCCTHKCTYTGRPKRPRHDFICIARSPQPSEVLELTISRTGTAKTPLIFLRYHLQIGAADSDEDDSNVKPRDFSAKKKQQHEEKENVETPLERRALESLKTQLLAEKAQTPYDPKVKKHIQTCPAFGTMGTSWIMQYWV